MGDDLSGSINLLNPKHPLQGVTCLFTSYMYALASSILGGYLVSKAFGQALGIYINEFSISPKREFNAIVDIPQSSRILVYFSFFITSISCGVHAWQIYRSANKKVDDAGDTDTKANDDVAGGDRADSYKASADA